MSTPPGYPGAPGSQPYAPYTGGNPSGQPTPTPTGQPTAPQGWAPPTAPAGYPGGPPHQQYSGGGYGMTPQGPPPPGQYPGVPSPYANQPVQGYPATTSSTSGTAAGQGGYPAASSSGAYGGPPPHHYPGSEIPALGPQSSGGGSFPTKPAPPASSAPPVQGYPNLSAGPNPGAPSTYGHLQHAPSFNSGPAGAAAAAAAAGGAGGAAAVPGDPKTGWVLAPPLPQIPQKELMGPFLRFNDYDPRSGTFATSVMVVEHPRLGGRGVQVHYAVDGPANQTAPCQLLEEYMGFKFWRFDIVVQLREAPAVCNYLVGLVGAQAPASSHTFNLPARGESWRVLSYSCNGFHDDAADAKYGGIKFLWADLMRQHASKRYHVQLGGGDQIYNDHVFELPALKPWLLIDDPHVRAQQPLKPEMLQQVEQFYFGHHVKHFTDPAWAEALACIPYSFIWDDHDIFDGWGSYPEYLQNSPVFQGMFAVARRFFLLFQQHCTYHNAGAISKTIGNFSYHQVRNLGNNMVLMMPDTRSERTPNLIVPDAGWDLMFNELQQRLASNPYVQHVVVLLTVPIVYPKIPFSEGILSGMQSALARSKPMRDAVGKIQNMPAGVLNQFNEPDLMDDLRDHWTSAEHVEERQKLIRRLQAIAQQYSVRVTFISGDVHVGGFGCFQAHPKQYNQVVDPKFMLQVISSAIGNEPPPPGVITALETSSMANTAMQDTLDKMIKAFPGNKKLRATRNYCEITQLPTPCTDPKTGLQQPPGGLCFTLRCENGPPGQPVGVETFYSIAPLLVCNAQAAGRVQNASFYTMQQLDPSKVKAGGMVNQVAGMLPGESGAKLQQGVKQLGHKLGNLLARV